MNYRLMSVMALVAAAGLVACRGDTVQMQANTPPPVPDRAEDVQPLGAGLTAPTAVLRNAEGEPVHLGTAYRDQPTMLLFYRGGWCPYCNEQLGQLAQAEDAIADMGIQIFGISPDRPQKLRDNPLSNAQRSQLLSDSDMALAKAFGLAFRVDDQTVEQYRGFGIDLEDASGHAHHLLPVPAVYLIDRDGVIGFAHWDTDYRERLTAEALIEAAQQIAR